MLRILILCILCLLEGGFPTDLLGQKIEKIRYRANTLVSVLRNGVRQQFLQGAVRFKHENANMYCDSALFFQKEQYLDAFGNIKLVDEGRRLYGRILAYDGKKRYARFRGDVRYVPQKGTLRTDSLDYDMGNEQAFFWGGAVLRDSAKTLTSRRGRYQISEKFWHVKDSVKVFHPDYTLYCDSLKGSETLGKSWIQGATKLWMGDTAQLHAHKGGVTMEEEDKIVFYEALMQTPTYHIWGDTLVFDQANSVHTAQGRVMIAIEDSLTLFGKKAVYEPEKDEIWMYGDAVVRKVLVDDTLYLRSDTLHMKQDGDVKNFTASPQVRMYGQDILALCDSVHYGDADSVIHMRRDIILWRENVQITANEADILFKEGHIVRIDLSGVPYVVEQDTLNFFNQATGRNMHLHFTQDTLRHIDIEGNSENIYHLLEGDTALVGMNRIVSGNAKLLFGKKKLQNALFKVNPKGTFFPPKDILPTNNRLKGFSWKPESKPDRANMLLYVDKHIYTDRPQRFEPTIRPTFSQ